MNNSIFDEQPKKTIFNNTGIPVDPELRPIWRIALISVVLYNLCAGFKANSKKIQVLCSLISSAEKRTKFKADQLFVFKGINIRFDPLIDRAVDLALGEEIFQLDNSKSVFLTKKGKVFAEKIMKEEDLLADERRFILNFDKRYFNENMINRLISGV